MDGMKLEPPVFICYFMKMDSEKQGMSLSKNAGSEKWTVKKQGMSLSKNAGSEKWTVKKQGMFLSKNAGSEK